MSTWNNTPLPQAVGWVCSYTPEEVIVAAGLTPYRMLGGAGSRESNPTLLPPNFCPFVRRLCAQGFDLVPQTLQGLVLVQSCDSMRRLSDVWARYLQPGLVHRLDLPRRRDSLAEDFLLRKLEGLGSALEAFTGSRLQNEDLKEAIQTVNRTRSLAQDLFRLHSSNPDLLGAGDLLRLLQQGFAGPHSEMQARLESAIAAIHSAEPNRKQGPARVRLLLTGSLIEDPELCHCLESAAADLVVDDTCSGRRHFDGLTDTREEPLRAIAKRLLQRPPCSRMLGLQHRLDRITRLARGHGCHGVIYHTLKFCDLVQSDLPPLRSRLEREQLPLLHLERESLGEDSGQLLTRVEAFVEHIQAQQSAEAGALSGARA